MLFPCPHVLLFILNAGDAIRQLRDLLLKGGYVLLLGYGLEQVVANVKGELEGGEEKEGRVKGGQASESCVRGAVDKEG